MKTLVVRENSPLLPYLLKTLVDCLRKDENLAGVGGEILKMNDKFYLIKNYFFPNWLLLTKAVQVGKKFEFHPKIISTSNMLVRKKRMVDRVNRI